MTSLRPSPDNEISFGNVENICNFFHLNNVNYTCKCIVNLKNSITFADKLKTTMANEIAEHISKAKPGALFFVSDFKTSRDNKAVSRIMVALEARGDIERIGNGIYCKPIRTQFGKLYPSIEEIVSHIAKRDHVQVLPSGITAENLLGFSTQVPITHFYITSGSSRQVIIKGQGVFFKRAVPRNFAFKNKLMAILAQALKSIGQKRIGKNEIAVIRELFSKNPDMPHLNHDLLLLPTWMRKIVSSALIQSK